MRFSSIKDINENLLKGRMPPSSGLQAFHIPAGNACTLQKVALQDATEARVNNVVDFGPKWGYLKVSGLQTLPASPHTYSMCGRGGCVLQG